jgi:signal peptidase I
MSPQPPTAGLTPTSSLLHAIQSLLFLIVIAIFISTFSAQPFRIPSGSMEKTLLIGDFLLVDKQLETAGVHDPLPATAIRYGDIIVFHYPVDPSLHLVKRVIGIPGDRIRLHDGRVYRNDKLLTEPYALYRPAPPDSFRDNFPRMQSAEPGIDTRWWIEMRHSIDHGDLIVPPNHYFVLGDNRNDSEDSRYWGFVPRSAIVGKPFLVYLSLSKPEQSEEPAAPQLTAPIHPRHSDESAIGHLANLVRWDRTLHVIH